MPNSSQLFSLFARLTSAAFYADIRSAGDMPGPDPHSSDDPAATGRTTTMHTIADTALRSVVGVIVVAAMFGTIWLARDSSTRAGVAATDVDAQPPMLQSARTDRSPVTRTSITREQLRALQASR
jgi:hypothetical protein